MYGVAVLLTTVIALESVVPFNIKSAEGVISILSAAKGVVAKMLKLVPDATEKFCAWLDREITPTKKQMSKTIIFFIFYF